MINDKNMKMDFVNQTKKIFEPRASLWLWAVSGGREKIWEMTCLIANWQAPEGYALLGATVDFKLKTSLSTAFL